MKKRKYNIVKGDDFKYHNVNYTDTYTKEMDEEGLSVLKWSMFDSPDKLGSGKYFMESEPVHILDEVFKRERLTGYIYMGYTSKTYADRVPLASNSAHRVGKAIKFKCLCRTKRFRFIRGLIQYGVQRIHFGDEWIYFDTDNYIKKPEIMYFK